MDPQSSTLTVPQGVCFAFLVGRKAGERLLAAALVCCRC